ncbi:5-dehydro-4-deoxy-D-glucuronate isomerase [Alicyclobacillus fodiniaquatilis]|uniref:4-deoxy-L-threo-5-hexosulose-uronate ketol-isomerase n=1 Tax=Alicyclobacillus fodiniaquatilis TaxID=1661150 RepID=A0ABW4JDX3_9BACL
MEIRHATNPEDFKQYSTERIRKDFLVSDLFGEDEVNTVYTHYDRVILGGALPVEKSLELTTPVALKVDYFLERRELGVVNIGGLGSVSVDGQRYEMAARECLYIGKGHKDVVFASRSSDEPAKFYLVSTPAHQAYPVQKVNLQQAQAYELGTASESNERTLYRFIHAEGIQSCQLMLGMTVLKPNNMWNTMPAHLHDRRMEAYLYFNLSDKARVIHLMGEPHETRHLIIQNEQAVISPSWSIHSGMGTSNYAFIWAMAGENYTFEDMDAVAMEDLR